MYGPKGYGFLTIGPEEGYSGFQVTGWSNPTSSSGHLDRRGGGVAVVDNWMGQKSKPGYQNLWNCFEYSAINVTRTKNYDTCLSFLPPKILRSSSLHLESSTPRHPHLPRRVFCSLEQGSFLKNKELNNIVCLRDEQNVLLSFHRFLVFQHLFKINWDSSLQSLLRQLKTPIGTPTSLTSFPI